MVRSFFLSFCLMSLSALVSASAVPVYDRAALHSESRSQVPDYHLILGSLEKVDGVVIAEKEERLAGNLLSRTYRAPSGDTVDQVYSFYQQQLKNLGMKEVFSCMGRECGSSNQWANSVFRNSRLYGIDRSQRYLVAGNESGYYIVYVVQRGNKKVYVRVDELLTGSSASEQAAWVSGRVEIAAASADQLVDPLFQLLGEVDGEVYVAVAAGDSNPGASIAKSEAAIALLQQALDQLDFDRTAVRFYLVGGLVPDVVKSGEIRLFLSQDMSQ